MRRNLHAGKRHGGGFSLNTLSEDELYEIHLATLEVLQRTGVFVQDPEAREIFDAAGASVDAKSNVVTIPPHLVEDSIRSAPSKLVLAGRDPKNDFVMESNRVGFTTFGEGIKIVDPETREVRAPTKADVADTARLADYADEVDVYERAVGGHGRDRAVRGLPRP